MVRKYLVDFCKRSNINWMAVGSGPVIRTFDVICNPQLF